jgi:hypothetical protein
MSDYSKITNFLSKDSLSLNDPAKYVKGSEIDAEYNAIAVAIATKADTASPTLTTPTMSSPTITGTITAAIANFSGLVTAALGLTVSGAAFNSRGITDNATAKALTLSGSGANSVTIANSATNPTIGTSAGSLAISCPVVVSPGSGNTFQILNGFLDVAGRAQVLSNFALPAGGDTGVVISATTSNIGIYFGSGAPTVSAAKGSIYLRSDGSATNNRMYVNTDGSTTWTAVTTAA